uniref:Uncharacterized protein n=1 Tax=Vitis vinifera TaxID=29760 RepID=F6GTS7_VITVI
METRGSGGVSYVHSYMA